MNPDMKRKLAHTGAKVILSIEQRDKLVREAVADGCSLREVGLAVGLSHPGVKKIVEREP